MARITEKVEIYIYQDVDTGARSYYTVELGLCPWLVHVGTTEALIEYDEADLIDPRTAQLIKAEQELESHRAEFAIKERQLLDKIESLRALPHLGEEHHG